MLRGMERMHLPHSGWGNGTVPVSHGASSTATIVEVTGWPLAAFYVYGLIDTPDQLEQGDMLALHHSGGSRSRSVVPRTYTHVKVDKSSVGSLPRWRLGFRSSDSLPQLVKHAEGRQSDVLRYTGAATAVRLETGEGHVTLTHHPFTGGEAKELHDTPGPYRGIVEVPGPGLIQVRCLVRWSLLVR